MQNECGWEKKSVVDIVTKIKQKSLATEAHFLTSRDAYWVLPLLLGIHLSILCAIWDGALDSSQ
jgi:hypothetical protein